MKSVEKKVFEGETLKLEEHYVYKEVNDTITSILNTPLCDNFTTLTLNLPAVCCKVMIANELSIFCTLISPIMTKLPFGFGLLILKCDNGTAFFHTNNVTGVNCFPMLSSQNHYSSRLSFDGENTNSAETYALPDTETLKDDAEEASTIFVDIRSTICKDIGTLDLCTQYVSFNSFLSTDQLR